MQFSRLRFSLPTLLIASGTILAGGVLAASLGFTPVPSANPRVTATARPNWLPPELTETPVAQGSYAVENPAPAVTIPPNCPSSNTSAVGFYGYDNDGTMLPNPAGDLPTSTHKVEATKTEPDENTYLVLRNQHGPDPLYDYGTHFLFQGHELGRGYITRINLDADGPHRVTILASFDSTATPLSTNATPGCPLPAIDGSGWDPFIRRLLFTSENSGNQSIMQATPDFPSTVDDLTSQIGHAAYEGVIPDKDGRIYLVEDAGGNTGSNLAGTVTDGSGTVSPAPPVDLSHTKQSNSFVYRFLPYPGPHGLLSGGILQVLQVESGSFGAPGAPITFTAPASSTQHDKQVAANHDLLSTNLRDLHTYGKTFKTKWITIHDTATCPTPSTCTSWNANTLAKSMGGTPFKRPENGRFRPGTYFSEFYFDETGDTDNTTAGPLFGGFGAIYKLELLPGDTGKLSLLYNSQDAVHSGFDNMSFWDKEHVVSGEDAGDTLHGQRNALDSSWVFDVRVDYDPAHGNKQPVRLEAEGRDASAALDTTFAGKTGFQNEGDNEITGFIVSNGDGDGDRDDVLGATIPTPFRDGWRVFYTQQHGDNFTWEILKVRDGDKDGDHDRDDDHGDHDRDGDHDRR
jgi:hypothetical protein